MFALPTRVSLICWTETEKLALLRLDRLMVPVMDYYKRGMISGYVGLVSGVGAVELYYCLI